MPIDRTIYVLLRTAFQRYRHYRTPKAVWQHWFLPGAAHTVMAETTSDTTDEEKGKGDSLFTVLAELTRQPNQPPGPLRRIITGSPAWFHSAALLSQIHHT
jgi:hypothetical protein